MRFFVLAACVQATLGQIPAPTDAPKPLTPEQEAANTERSRVRARIEHVFGHIETAMHGCFVRTIGIARAKAKIGLEVIAYNMSRFTFLMRSRGIVAPA